MWLEIKLLIECNGQVSIELGRSEIFSEIGSVTEAPKKKFFWGDLDSFPELKKGLTILMLTKFKLTTSNSVRSTSVTVM